MKESFDRLLFMWSIARQWRWRLFASLLALTFVSAASLLYPWLLKMMADRFIGAPDIPDPGLLACLLGVVFLLSSLAGYAQQVEMQSLGYRLRNTLRVEFFRMLLRQPMSFFSGQQAGELSSRVTEDFSRLQPLFANLLAPLFQNMLVVSGCLVFMWRINGIAATVVLSLMLLPLPLILIFSRRIMRSSAASTSDHAEANALLEECIVGIREIKAFVREEVVVSRYATLQRSAFREERSTARLQISVNQSVSFFLSLLLITIFYIGTSGTLLGGWALGNGIAFYFYTYTLVMAAVSAGKVMLTWQGIAGAFDRTYRLMREERYVSPVPTALTVAPVRGRIEFRDVHFAYNDSVPVLRGVSFVIDEGTTVLLSGSSGSGKSTIVNLIIALYAPGSGSILIDDIPIQDYETSRLRRAVGYVGQDPMLFRGTIRENIQFGGSDVDVDQFRRVLHVTCLEETLADLPKGLETQIGERGHTLSGGEKARIAIARATVQRPPILILDEANAMLGENVERRLWPLLLDERKGLTTVILSHHHEFLPAGYRLLHLHDGRIEKEVAAP